MMNLAILFDIISASGSIVAWFGILQSMDQNVLAKDLFLGGTLLIFVAVIFKKIFKLD